MKKLWNWGVGIATVYTIFAGATLGFVAFAMQQPVDLVSPEYYAEAEHHEARQLAAERALSLGDTFRIEQDSLARTVTITWPANGRPMSGQVVLYRPSNSHADRHVDIHPDTQGVQVISLGDLAPGGWTVKCEWKTAAGDYYAERQVVRK